MVIYLEYFTFAAEKMLLVTQYSLHSRLIRFIIFYSNTSAYSDVTTRVRQLYTLHENSHNNQLVCAFLCKLPCAQNCEF